MIKYAKLQSSGHWYLLNQAAVRNMGINDMVALVFMPLKGAEREAEHLEMHIGVLRRYVIGATNEKEAAGLESITIEKIDDYGGKMELTAEDINVEGGHWWIINLGGVL